MRLVDADALRDALIHYRARTGQLPALIYSEARHAIDAAPTVSCEECKWIEKDEDDCLLCNLHGDYMADDWACSSFGRREP